VPEVNIKESDTDPLSMNGTHSLDIRKDLLKVVAHITPPRGGTPVSEDALLSALSAEGIDSNRINLDSLEKAVRANREMSIVVARGLTSVKGADARFISLVKGVTAVPVNVNDAELVDYFDLWTYTSVKAGAPLMQRIPPTGGIEGVNVLGARLPVKAGKSIKFTKSKGAEIDPENEHLLIASRDGHPILQAQGVEVDDMLILAKASLETGHIDFNGSVAINGDVDSQVEIRASGDIFIKGTVSNAKLEAAHDIVIGGGVLSQAGPNAEIDSHLITSEIIAGNSIQALFLNQAVAKSGNTIDIQRYVLNSELRAQETIYLGQSGGKGAIIGGLAVAAYSITANLVGSNAYVVSELQCVVSDHVYAKNTALTQELEKRRHEINELVLIAKRLNENENGRERVNELTHQKLLKIIRTIKTLRLRVELIAKKTDEIAMYLAKSEKAFIHIDRQIYPNTRLKIGTAVKLIDKELRQTRAVCIKGEVLLS
jgi:uncharacterized protein (DUF342 family)